MGEIKSIRARVYWLQAEEGGRRTPISTGYRPSAFWDGLEERGGNDGHIILEDRDQCLPGDECIIRMDFYCPKLVPDSVKSNTTFTLREGRVVAKGIVLEVF